MAGHKGYGIALLVEVLAGVLTGAGVLSEVKSWVLQRDQQAHLGQMFIAIDVGAIIPVPVLFTYVDSGRVCPALM